MTRVAILGARGRMGSAIARLAPEHEAEVVLRIDADTGTLDDLARAKPNVLIDFSVPHATADAARACTLAGVALVSGTTGLDEAAKRAIDDAARAVPVLWEPNMSVGVLVLGEVVRQALAMLGESYDVEIVETHHKKKKDAPSGTALRLAEIVR